VHNYAKKSPDEVIKQQKNRQGSLAGSFFRKRSAT